MHQWRDDAGTYVVRWAVFIKKDRRVWAPLGKRVRGKSSPPLPKYTPPPEQRLDFLTRAAAEEFVTGLRQKHGADTVAYTIIEPAAPRQHPQQMQLI